MLWVWIFLGVIALLAATPFVVGRFLPERYSASVRMEVARSVDDVWNELADYRQHPMGGRMVRGVEPLESSNGLPAWVEDLGSTKLQVKTTESAAPRRVVRELADQVVPMTGRSSFDLGGDEKRCSVTVDAQIVIRSGTWHVPVFRFMMAIQKGAQRTAVAHLRGVARRLGAEPSFEVLKA